MSKQSVIKAVFNGPIPLPNSGDTDLSPREAMAVLTQSRKDRKLPRYKCSVFSSGLQLKGSSPAAWSAPLGLVLNSKQMFPLNRIVKYYIFAADKRSLVISYEGVQVGSSEVQQQQQPEQLEHQYMGCATIVFKTVEAANNACDWIEVEKKKHEQQNQVMEQQSGDGLSSNDDELQVVEELQIDHASLHASAPPISHSAEVVYVEGSHHGHDDNNNFVAAYENLERASQKSSTRKQSAAVSVRSSVQNFEPKAQPNQIGFRSTYLQKNDSKLSCKSNRSKKSVTSIARSNCTADELGQRVELEFTTEWDEEPELRFEYIPDKGGLYEKKNGSITMFCQRFEAKQPEIIAECTQSPVHSRTTSLASSLSDRATPVNRDDSSMQNGNGTKPDTDQHLYYNNDVAVGNDYDGFEPPYEATAF